VIGDVSKMEVYALARYYNGKAGRAMIPESCFSKIPSAELKPDQFDPFDYPVVSPSSTKSLRTAFRRPNLFRRDIRRTLLTIPCAEYGVPSTSDTKLHPQSR
jgi:hypothetical protein